MSNVPTIGSATAYIDGPLRGCVANAGTNTVNFPIERNQITNQVVYIGPHTDAKLVLHIQQVNLAFENKYARQLLIGIRYKILANYGAVWQVFALRLIILQVQMML